MKTNVRINPSGLFRCCIQTLRNQSEYLPDLDGETVSCQHCQETMIRENGTWKWMRQREKEKEQLAI